MALSAAGEKFKLLHEGCLGFFWPVGSSGMPDLSSDPERGFIQIEAGWARVDLLDEDPTSSMPTRVVRPQALVAALAGDSALLVEIVGPSYTRRFNSGASSKQVRARSVMQGVDIDLLQSTHVRSLRADLLSTYEWSGLAPLTETLHAEKDGRIQGWDLSLRKLDPVNFTLPRARTVELSAQWSVQGPSTERVLRCRLGVECSSTRPRPIWDLLEPILHVQDLLSVAHDGFVVASGGGARLDLRSLQSPPIPVRETSAFWNGLLMSVPEGVTAFDGTSSITRFDLAALGGGAGVRRWINLCASHGRAVSPVVSPFRMGRTSWPVRLMEVASGIEYWVAAHSKTKWGKVKGLPKPELVARRSREFQSWIGDTHNWSDKFWATYNGIKHDPKRALVDVELAVLAESGALLLLAVLIERTAMSSVASKQLFSHPQSVRLRERLTQIGVVA